jgi:hypothetical protein
MGADPWLLGNSWYATTKRYIRDFLQGLVLVSIPSRHQTEDMILANNTDGSAGNGRAFVLQTRNTSLVLLTLRCGYGKGLANCGHLASIFCFIECLKIMQY